MCEFAAAGFALNNLQEKRDPNKIRESEDAILEFLNASSRLGRSGGFPGGGKPEAKEAAFQQEDVISKGGGVVKDAAPLGVASSRNGKGWVLRSSQKAV